MKINYLKINQFGKLKNKEIKLENNINLIYGKNEAGKTTLLKFISSILIPSRFKRAIISSEYASNRNTYSSCLTLLDTPFVITDLIL